MVVKDKQFQKLLLEWIDAKDETDRLLGQYFAVQVGEIPDASVPMPERQLDIEGVRLITQAKRKEEECKDAFLKAARKETGRTV